MNEQLEQIANELMIRGEVAKKMPRLAENDEYNDVLINIAIDEMEEEDNYTNR